VGGGGGGYMCVILPMMRREIVKHSNVKSKLHNSGPTFKVK
jgi:hypothetical protein